MISDSTWPVTTNRYVGFLDIMGFKDMVARSSQTEIYEMMKKINGHRKYAEGIKWKGVPPDLVRSTTYSDSIMLYSKDDTFESLDSLISSISALTHYFILEGIPFKGAISFGSMTLDIENSIFFGQPLIDAYLLQEEVQFYGVIVHSSVEKEIINKKFSQPAFLAYYLCKLKGGAAKHLTIYPMYARESVSKGYEDKTKALFDSILKFRLNTSGGLRKYIDNTEEYLDAMKKR